MKRFSRRKFVKNVKHRIPWVGHIINEEKAAGDLNIDRTNLEVQAHEGGLCLVCRGSKMLCGNCLLYTSPSPRDRQRSRMPSSA